MATSDIPLDRLTAAIRNIYQNDPANAAGNVEEELQKTFTDCSPAERNDSLKDLLPSFVKIRKTKLPLREFLWINTTNY